MACLGLALSLPFFSTPTEEDFRRMRERMVQVVERETAETENWTGAAKLGERVLQAMREVPRHEFVPDDHHREAYDNRPLPIGHGQTISQPFIVAIMTELLKPQEGDVVLEVGTGSGYQAAILSRLVSHVYSIEIIPELGEQAKERLERLGFTNVEVRVGDGYYGWQEHAPYDGIIVTAAAGNVPPALIDQLKPGGRMVIPVGSPFLTQQLVLIEKDDAGEIKTRQLLPVAFVPLTGAH
jgi:protein-L-isoaspartate(D-aspartate) O-methyltransferase